MIIKFQKLINKWVDSTFYVKIVIHHHNPKNKELLIGVDKDPIETI
jgi:hypothetical protein